MKETVARLKCGEWLNAFPEGKVIQGANYRLATFRWGVSSIIHQVYDHDPIVIPIVVQGMEHVYPLSDRIPRLGQKIRVRIGPPISFSDLIEEHRRRNDPIHSLLIWHRSPAHLHDAMTRRLFNEMQAMQNQLGEQTN